MNALLSVSDKTGIVEFAQALHALGIKLVMVTGDNRRTAAAVAGSGADPGDLRVGGYMPPLAHSAPRTKPG